MGRPRGSNTDVRREMIVAAAVRVFAYRGYDAATLQEVGDLVGITRPAVHHYFPGKASLYRAALDRAYDIALTPAEAHPLETFSAAPEGEFRMACAFLGTSLSHSHRIADVAPRITTVVPDLRRLCEDAVGSDGGGYRADVLITVIVGRWVLAASALTPTDIGSGFELL